MTCPRRVGGAQRAVFRSVYCSQAAASATLRSLRSTLLGSLWNTRLRCDYDLEVTAQLKPTYLIRRCIVDNHAPRTGTSAAPPLRANSMTSVTSSLPVLARTPLYPPQYPYSRQASDSSPASTKTLVTLLTLSSKTIQIMWDTQSDVRSHLRYAPRLYLNTGKYLTRATPGHEHSSWALRRPWRSTRSARSSSAPAQMTVT